MDLKINQKVKHSLTRECLTIKKINGNIVVCLIEKPFISNGILIDSCICSIKNLKP